MLRSSDVTHVDCCVRLFFKRRFYHRGTFHVIQSRVTCSNKKAAVEMAQRIAIRLGIAVYGHGKPGFVACSDGKVNWGK